MPRIVERWLLFKYINGESTPLSKLGEIRCYYPKLYQNLLKSFNGFCGPRSQNWLYKYQS
jgi:hypothetical protein